jgi:hypothetical protein
MRFKAFIAPMSLGALLVGVTVIATARPTPDQSISQKISQLQSAESRGMISRLSIEDQSNLNGLLGQAVALVYSDHLPTPPGTLPGPPPGDHGDWRHHDDYNRNKVIAYTDDNCSQTPMEVRAHDSCDKLQPIYGSQRVWSVSINGRCINTPDTIFNAACGNLLSLANSQSPHGSDLEVFMDDNCSDSQKLTDIDPYMDCGPLSTVLMNMRVWSVRFEGKCVNIPDTTFSPQSCQSFQNAVLARYENDGQHHHRGDVELFTDDSCSDANSITTITSGDNCDALNGVFNGTRVWSVKFRGQCVNIPDTTFLPACQSYAK